MKGFAQLKDQYSHALCSGDCSRGGLTIRKSIWGEGEHDRVERQMQR